jgi:plastocyanin
VVPRQRLILAAVCAALPAAAHAAVVPASARAADAKIAIGHYKWSHPVVHVDLGQHVTWYWVGPDTMHSVTGISGNNLTLDSDPRTSEPHHRIGDKFQLSFSQPGVYEFQCKLHPIVHGEVVVSDTPGDPADDPDPIPPPNVDLMRPELSGISLQPRRFALAGTTLHFALDDSSTVDAEIWHTVHGRRATYAGWQQWRGHIGFNQIRFASRHRHFKPHPGSYIAYLTPTDLFANVGRTKTVRFTIAPPRPSGRSQARR